MKSTNHQQYKKQQLTRAASLKTVRKRLDLFVIAIIVVAIGAAATVAFAVTPVNGRSVGHPAPPNSSSDNSSTFFRS